MPFNRGNASSPQTAEGFKQHLGVALGPENRAPLRQFVAQLNIIVDFAVEDDLQCAIRADHWLICRLRYVDDR